MGLAPRPGIWKVVKGPQGGQNRQPGASLQPPRSHTLLLLAAMGTRVSVHFLSNCHHLLKVGVLSLPSHEMLQPHFCVMVPEDQHAQTHFLARNELGAGVVLVFWVLNPTPDSGGPLLLACIPEGGLAGHSASSAQTLHCSWRLTAPQDPCWCQEGVLCLGSLGFGVQPAVSTFPLELMLVMWISWDI